MRKIIWSCVVKTCNSATFVFVERSRFADDVSLSVLTSQIIDQVFFIIVLKTS